MSHYLIVGAIVVNEGKKEPLDVEIKAGRIAKIAPSILATPSMQVVEAKGRYLIPGMIDDQVHFREPGLTHKGDLLSESQAAVAGGITSFMEMPNTQPPTVTRQALVEKYALAKSRQLNANYAFYLGATNDNLDEIRALEKNEACAVKVFMGASTGNMLVDRPDVLEGIFSSCPLLIATHCEDTPTIKAQEERFRAEYGEEVPMHFHSQIRSRDACLLSSTLAVSLAKKYQHPLHVLHITTADELALFTKGDIDHKLITAEVCVHHLSFARADYLDKGALIKCNPAIKEESDRQALIRAISDDVIDIIATDHAPHTLAEKAQSYFQAPSGLPLVQHALLALFELSHQGLLSVEKLVEKTSHAVAKRYGVVDRGFIREGYFADLVLVDAHTAQTINREDCLSKCAWSPFEGRTLHANITHTWVNGVCAYEKGKVITPSGFGARLQFA